MAARSRKRTSPITPRAKVWLERDGRYVFGRGLSDILKAVAQAGSIKEAAPLVGKSYRHVWSRIKTAERDLGEPLVQTRIGGADSQRSELTPRACELIREFDELRKRVFEAVERRFAAQDFAPRGEAGGA